MFKKDHRTKPVAAIKNSDRRKLRAQILSGLNLNPDDHTLGDLLVPEGIKSARFTTHSEQEQGTLYVDGTTSDPLWFTFGKGSAAATTMIPTVYSLWKHPSLLPATLSTPLAALEKVKAGADLMIPGVSAISTLSTSDLPTSTLVSIAGHGSTVPMAVGQLALPLRDLTKIVKSEEEVKGKAVIVMHAYGDCLWRSGSKREPPSPEKYASTIEGATELGINDGREDASSSVPPFDQDEDHNESTGDDEGSPEPELTASEIDANLQLALLQTISSSSSSNLTSSLPCPATTFLTSYLQPCRPYPSPPLDLKKSSYKSLTKFLKSVDKSGLIKIKETKTDSGVTVVSVNPTHPEVVGHTKSYRTVGEVEERERKMEQRRREEAERVVPMQVEELWKPTGSSVAFFEAKGKDPDGFFTASEVRTLLNAHIASENLVHPREAAYIILDDLLRNVLRSEDNTEFLKRSEVPGIMLDKMEKWHRLGDAPPKKGALVPIHITQKVRNGRKTSTIVTDFEVYSSESQTFDQLSEDFAKLCASATMSSPVTGQAKNAKAMKIVVQGKHAKAIREYFMSRGVPKACIEEVDLTGGKKKKTT